MVFYINIGIENELVWGFQHVIYIYIHGMAGFFLPRKMEKAKASSSSMALTRLIYVVDIVEKSNSLLRN